MAVLRPGKRVEAIPEGAAAIAVKFIVLTFECLLLEIVTVSF